MPIVSYSLYVCATCKVDLPINCQTRRVLDPSSFRQTPYLHLCQCDTCLWEWRSAFTWENCAACNRVHRASETYAMRTGQRYCSELCYDTLFDICKACDQKNISVLTGIKCGFCGLDALCDACYRRKHKLTTTTIVFGPFKRR